MWDKLKQWFDTKIKNKKEKVKSNIIFVIILFAILNTIYIYHIHTEISHFYFINFN